MRLLNDHRRIGAVLAGLALLSLVSPEEELSANDAAVSATGPFIRVLGSVQDGGMPHAACNHILCQRALDDPRLRKLVASLALIDPSTQEVYLFDATPDVREQLVALADARRAPSGRVDRAPLTGVFLTHAHIGHYLGLSFFGFEAVNTKGLPVYATPRMSSYLRSNGPWSQLVEMQNIELRESPPGKLIELNSGVTVMPLAVPHRDELSDTVGFLIRGPSASILYVPDTDNWAAWTVPIEDVVKNVDIVLLDGSFYSADEMPGRSVTQIGHPLISDTMRRLERLVQEDGKRVYFTHLNHSNPALDAASPERREIEQRGFKVVTEGQEFPL